MLTKKTPKNNVNKKHQEGQLYFEEGHPTSSQIL
jgi:hypothetical protein